MIPAMLIVSMIAGGIWGLLPAIPRAYLKVKRDDHHPADELHRHPVG